MVFAADKDVEGEGPDYLKYITEIVDPTKDKTPFEKLETESVPGYRDYPPLYITEIHKVGDDGLKSKKKKG